MSRTIHRVHPRTLMWYKSEPSTMMTRYRIKYIQGRGGSGPSETYCSMTVDKHGNAMLQRWMSDRTDSANRRYTNRQQRAANKIKIKLGLADHYDTGEEVILWDEQEYDQYMQDWLDEIEAECKWFDEEDHDCCYDEPDDFYFYDDDFY